MERRFELALRDFESALARLHEAAALDETDIVRDALIQRFEFTFEAAWKAMHRWFGGRGIRVDSEAFTVLKRAFANSLVDDEGLWNDLRRYRNLTSHTYQEKLAVEVAGFIRNRAIGAFDAALAALRARAEE